MKKKMVKRWGRALLITLPVCITLSVIGIDRYMQGWLSCMVFERAYRYKSI